MHEDSDIVVVDKPAGLLTIATEKERKRTLYAALRDVLSRRRPPERVFIVHRLDRDASGLLVFAKHPQAKLALQRQFHDRTASRTYVAVVAGTFREDRATFRSYLAENAAHRVYTTRSAEAGKLAVTHVRVLARRPGRSLLEVELETGRKHQIRVHLAEAGHPILGDERYGGPAFGRLALHAARLCFRHPGTGQSLAFQSSTPTELGNAAAAAVRKPTGEAPRPKARAARGASRGADRARGRGGA